MIYDSLEHPPPTPPPLHWLHTKAHFINGLSATNWNLEKILFALVMILMTQFAYATNFQLSSYVQNCDLLLT